MSERMNDINRKSGELGRDLELASALEALDPARQDPNYWMRFREWVVTNSAAELARRRLMAELTMSDVMSSWARTLVPTAALAAALAGLMLFRTQPVEIAHEVSLEEMLTSEVDGETIPVTLGADDSESAVTFASEIF